MTITIIFVVAVIIVKLVYMLWKYRSRISAVRNLFVYMTHYV